MASQVFDREILLEETFLETVEVYESIGSTNDRALQLCQDPDVILPALVVAEQQTVGRGQPGKTWQSSVGALTTSLVFENGSQGFASDSGLIPAVAVAATIDFACFGNFDTSVAKIKWPNDIYLRDKKIAGLLVESPRTAVSPARTVVGIGLNVNNKTSELEFEDCQATSLIEIIGSESDREDLIVQLLDHFSYFALEENRARLQIEIRERCLLRSKEVVVHSGSVEISGKCAGIQSDGTLLVKQQDGTKKSITSGTVVSWK